MVCNFPDSLLFLSPMTSLAIQYKLCIFIRASSFLKPIVHKNTDPKKKRNQKERENSERLTPPLHRSQIEPALGILCACLMTLRPLFSSLNLNLHLFHLPSIPKAPTSSADPIFFNNQHGHNSLLHQQPAVSYSRRQLKDNSRYSNSCQDLHIVTVDLGTTGNTSVQLEDFESSRGAGDADVEFPKGEGRFESIASERRRRSVACVV